MKRLNIKAIATVFSVTIASITTNAWSDNQFIVNWCASNPQLCSQLITKARPDLLRPQGDPASAQKNQLSLFWNHSGTDNFTGALLVNENPSQGRFSGKEGALAKNNGYKYVRGEGCPLAKQHNGTIPLKLYYHSGKKEYASAATPESIAQLEKGLYKYIRTQGYVFTSQREGTVPAYQYHSPKNNDLFLAISQTAINDATNGGYNRVKIEGWIYPDTSGCILY